MSVWDGGQYDMAARLDDLQGIGYDGIERIYAQTEASALYKAAERRKAGMGFATVRGPNLECSIQWAAGLGGEYVWIENNGGDFDTFCRMANIQAAACGRWGIKAGLHNHLGTVVESQEELESFLQRCPDVGLVFDTAHLAAAGGDAVEIASKYGDRVLAVHVKDWLEHAPNAKPWSSRGRFCELGAGNIDLDNKAVVEALRSGGYDGWYFVEHDTHLQEPLKDLAISREYLRACGL
jgi:sugar phosphate isomerase/epimerase